MLTKSQLEVFAFLKRMQYIHGPDGWFTPADVNEGTSIPTTCGGCARLLQSLVKMGQVEVRTATTVGRWPRVEYRAVIVAQENNDKT